MLTKKRFLKLTAHVALFLLLAGVAQVLIAQTAVAAPTAEECFPTTPDPFMGDWKGRWSADEEIDPDIAAQVIPLGKDMYRIRLVSHLFMRCPPLAQIEVKRKGDKLSFNEQGYRGEIKGDKFTGSRESGKPTFEMTKYVLQPPSLGQAPPEGAIVLFDGKNFDQWDGTDGWQLLDNGVMMVTPKGGYLTSKAKFKDVQLHVEFRLPYMPEEREQGRGNSGVFVQDVYEVQVLDSFGLEGYYNECGGLYKVAAPLVNACLPPLDWQTYDITYRAPRYDDAGKLVENPRITVYQNGILIQKDTEMPWITAWKEVERLAPAPKDAGPIKLQGHNNFVQYRNVWVVDMGSK